MPNPMDIINKLQNILFLKNEIITTQDAFITNQDKNKEDRLDVPFVDDDEYVTHRPFGETKEIKEQEKEEEEEEEEVPVEVPKAKPAVEPGGEEVAVEDPAMGDMGAEAGMDPGMDAGMGMPGEEEEPLTPSQIGRVYELKKIYTRLSALENTLQNVTDTEMIEIRNLISKATDLFKTLASNFEVYKDRLDDIIIIFYKFLDISYKKVRDYFKNNKNNED